MNQKPVKGLLKHADFIILDLITLQLCFVLAFWIIRGISNPYSLQTYSFLAVVLFMSQLCVTVFGMNYKGIIRRGRLDELFSVIKYTLYVMAVALVFLFVIKQGGAVSRLQTGVTLALFIPIDWIVRILNRKRIYSKSTDGVKRIGRSLVLMTAGRLVDDAMEKLTDTDLYLSYFVAGIITLDGDKAAVKGKYNLPLLSLNKSSIARLRSKWVDEVFILQPDDIPIDRKLMHNLIEMGLTVHMCPEMLTDEDWAAVELRKVGRFRVLTSSIKFVPTELLIVKRAMDILGGIVGCIITAILFIFIAPAIYLKSPGPIFFKQDRIGKNGKVFKMYKFRTMYMDAEERKAALMEQNKIESGLMFKMDDDPRIIGSEKKDKNGKPKGIGNFLRSKSLDEFPQFFNVLKGDMSLVGTRPPTVQEFEMYSLHHRVRMTTKPGITGMWQISGRSEITDFEEVVRLDREYIENWSIGLDIKILLKTVIIVLKGKGAE